MILYGAGGHGRTIFECLQSKGQKLTAVFDDDPAIKIFLKDHRVSRYDSDKFPEERVVVSIGSNSSRQKASKIVKHEFGIAVHVSATISSEASIGEGSMVLANSVVQIGTLVRDHVIINTGAIVEHDCLVGDCAHIGPGAVICGGVRVGEGVLVGANATVLPGVTIGNWSIIGAGTVVTEDVPYNSKIVGNPGKLVNS